MSKLQQLILIILFLLVPNITLATATEPCLKVGIIGEYKHYTRNYDRYFGREIYQGVNTAVQLAKRHHQCVKLYKLETNNSLANIPMLIKQAATQSDVHIFIGLGFSTQIAVGLPTLNKTHSILISPTASSDALKHNNRIVTFFPSQNDITVQILHFLLHHHVKKIGILFAHNDMYDYSAQISHLLAKKFKQHGGKVAYTIALNQNDLSLAPYQKEINDQSVEYIFLPMSDVNAARVILQLASMHTHAIILGADSWATYAPKIQQLIHSIDKHASLTAYVPIMYAASLKNPPNQTFVKAYTHDYKTKPTDMAAFSYDAMRLIFEMRKKCGPTKMLNQLQNCVISLIPFKTTTGEINSYNDLYLGAPIIFEKFIMESAS